MNGFEKIFLAILLTMSQKILQSGALEEIQFIGTYNCPRLNCLRGIVISADLF